MSKKPKTGAVGGPIRGDLLLSSLNRIKQATEAADEKNMDRASAWKAAKAAGFDTEALKVARKGLNRDSADATRFFQNIMGYVEVMAPGLLSQQDLFADVQPASKEAMTEHDLLEIAAAGRAAGKAGERARDSHGYDQGTPEADRWERGWLAGMGENAPIQTPGTDHMGAALEEASTRETATPTRGRSGPKGKAEEATGDALVSVVPEDHGKPAKAAKKPAQPELKAKGPKAAAATKKAGPKAKAPVVKAGPKAKAAVVKAGPKGGKKVQGWTAAPETEDDEPTIGRDVTDGEADPAPFMA